MGPRTAPGSEAPSTGGLRVKAGLHVVLIERYRTVGLELTAEETEAVTREANRRVPHARLHDLGHGAARAGLAAGVPRELVGRQLGHSRASTMTELYQNHPVDEAEQVAADKIAARLDGPG